MKNENQIQVNESQQVAPETTPVGTTETQEIQALPITEVTPVDPLPRGVRIFESLSTSFKNIGTTFLCITVAVHIIAATWLWVRGIISTDMYFELLRLFFEALQNLIMV